MDRHRAERGGRRCAFDRQRHLARLVEGQLIACLSQGRHRYYRLAGHDVAELVEQMMGLSWSRITPPETTAPKAMREARTCYDHLAGTVAVLIYDFMQAEGWLELTVQRSRCMAASSF